MRIINVGLRASIRLFGSRGQRDILSLSRQACPFAIRSTEHALLSAGNWGLRVSAPACQLFASEPGLLLAHFGFAKVSVNLALMAPEMRWAHIIALAASF